MRKHLTSECCSSIQSDKTWLIKKYGILSWDVKMLTTMICSFRITCPTYPHPKINQPGGDPHRWCFQKTQQKNTR